ncbi:hypothetical protein CFIMG_005751RAa [Ceratocystis fimbriata CBS 114723]|uniref:Uncharacterized protein n=1 Tax=Ceratocystis fimbriata CBS 114723 TaxID=1035309 RepID=A0A2C5X0J1_9PEZI|nr:hypothetical protein CFIMG_005751RAa [Ceratocystis fimbriata CBS 114723]
MTPTSGGFNDFRLRGWRDRLDGSRMIRWIMEDKQYNDEMDITPKPVNWEPGVVAKSTRASNSSTRGLLD